MDTVIVSNSQFYSHYPKRIPQGTVNAEAVIIRLDSEWDNLTVRIHWLNVAGGVEKVVLLERDQPNTIPWEVLVDLSELRMGLDGMDGGTIVKPTVWLTYGYVVDGVDPEAGDDPQPPTPSWEQQMVEQAEAAANAAKEAKETADNLQDAAEAGEFNGDPGPAGPPGKSPIIRNGTWWIWNNDSQDYTDTGVVASGGGGGGVTSYNDLSDRPSIGGILLEGNKTAQDLGLQPKGNYATTSSKLANPFFITFAGAVEATYDGSQAVTVTIPTIAGPPGATPDIQIGTVETLDPGSDATATITGPPEEPRLNLGIPRGQNGKTPVKGTDYFTEAEIQDVAKQAAALVPGGGGGEAGGERQVADYEHQGNQEIHFSSIDWATGVCDCTEPHNLTEPKKVLIVPNNWWDGAKYVGAGVVHIPIEWIVYTGASIYVVPVDETRVKITGADKTTMIPVNTDDVSNTNLDATKFHVEIPIGFIISNLPVNVQTLRIFAFGFSGLLSYRYVQVLTDTMIGMTPRRVWPTSMLSAPRAGLSKCGYALPFWYDITVEAAANGTYFDISTLYLGQRQGYSSWVADKTKEDLSSTYAPASDNNAKWFTGIEISSIYACYANHTIFRLYAKAVKE